MKYHDILGVMITADEQEIIKAYNSKIMALDADLSKKYPKTYARKVKELDNARRDCLEYISKPYPEKVKSELGDCITTHSEPNRVNSDCCCYDCCGCICAGIEIGAALGGLACIVSSVKTGQERYWRAQLDQVTKDINSINTEQTNKRPKFEEAQTMSGRLKPRIALAADTYTKVEGEVDVFHNKIAVLNEFLSLYDRGFNLSEVEANNAYTNKANSAYREMKQLEYELESATGTINEFEKLNDKRRELEARRIEIQGHLK